MHSLPKTVFRANLAAFGSEHRIAGQPIRGIWAARHIRANAANAPRLRLSAGGATLTIPADGLAHMPPIKTGARVDEAWCVVGQDTLTGLYTTLHLGKASSLDEPGGDANEGDALPDTANDAPDDSADNSANDDASANDRAPAWLDDWR